MISSGSALASHGELLFNPIGFLVRCSCRRMSRLFFIWFFPFHSFRMLFGDANRPDAITHYRRTWSRDDTARTTIKRIKTESRQACTASGALLFKQGEWQMELLDSWTMRNIYPPLIPLATHFDNWYKAWHNWASMLARVWQKCTFRARARKVSNHTRCEQ
ncbi:hypothetical protein BGY98DRAFT_1128304 [Russula aff. rugulosa BPL654]|nr:hypothetical protein BGY98DRAFT_1128304 [Russula aff. rugulosa BPL654]